MTNEILSASRGEANSTVAKKLGLSIKSLENILNGYGDEEFLQKFKLTEETLLMIRNEIGISGLRGIIISRII